MTRCQCPGCVYDRAAVDKWRRMESDRPYAIFKFWHDARNVKFGQFAAKTCGGPEIVPPGQSSKHPSLPEWHPSETP